MLNAPQVEGNALPLRFPPKRREMSQIPKGVAPTHTHEKLTAILGNFDPFDREMQEGTKQRREFDERRLREMSEEMQRLESNLETEIKRRVDMNQQLQAWMVTQIQEMTRRFNALLSSRMAAVEERLDRVVEKLTALEEYFKKMAREIPEEIEERCAVLNKQLQDFRDDFDAERRRRLEREAEFPVRLALNEKEVADAFAVENAAREEKFEVLRDTLDDTTESRIRGDAKFQAFVEDRMLELNAALARETKRRVTEDDDIVDALNRYTSKLQSSLQIINQTDL